MILCIQKRRTYKRMRLSTLLLAALATFAAGANATQQPVAMAPQQQSSTQQLVAMAPQQQSTTQQLVAMPPQQQSSTPTAATPPPLHEDSSSQEHGRQKRRRTDRAPSSLWGDAEEGESKGECDPAAVGEEKRDLADGNGLREHDNGLVLGGA